MDSAYKEALQEAYDYIRRQFDGEPEIGIILGTGLGGLCDQIEEQKAFPYNFIPHFPISTVESHFGRLIFGKLGGKNIVAMQGRFHHYEGYSMKEITFPVRVMKMLGVETLFISNASGGLNLDFANGDLVVIDDHINMLPSNPLVGPSDPMFGPRFPDMSRPYDPVLSQKALEIGKRKGFSIHEGIYIAVSGPNLETRAEYRMLRNLGADIVGMSTVPEVLVASQSGIKVCAVSVITDMGDPDNLGPITIEDVVAVANEAEPRLTALMAELIESL
ncbi:MAG: purine-nucleoside phosphorylase [Bacteroidia bacterium]